MKQVLSVQRSPQPHWVGNGFPVRSLFTYDRQAAHVSPFLLLDYAGPHVFAPLRRVAVSGSTRTAALRPSPSSIRARSSTATPRALAD